MNVRVTDVPVPVEPSPKFQLVVYGAVPPAVVPEKVTAALTTGLEGDTVKLVASGSVAVTIIDCELVAV